MEEKENPYELLNLSINADPKKIKERYYFLSRVFHPDKQSSEMYEHSKKYFEKIEESYKAIASPFNRFLFENLGFEGIHILEKAPNKFIDLEEAYDFAYELYYEAINNSQYDNSNQLNERKAKLKRIQQSILRRFSFLLRKSSEQATYIRFYKNLVCSTEIDCSYYFETQRKNFKPKNKIFMTNLMLSSNVLLPEFFNTQMEMGFFLVSQKRNDFKAGFLFGLHRTIKLPILKAVDLKMTISYNNQKNLIGIMIGKQFEQGLIQANVNVTNEGITPVLSFTKPLTETSTIAVSTLLSQNAFQINPSFIYNLKKYQIKSTTDFDLSSNGIELSQTLMKKINKLLSIHYGVNTSVKVFQKNEYQLQFSNFIGMKYNLSKASFIEIVHHIGMRKNGISLKYTRYTFKFEIPFNFSAFPTVKGLAFQSAVVLTSIILIKIGGWVKKNNPRRRIKLERTNKIRLIEQKSGFNMFLNDLHQLADKSLHKETKLILKNKKGLIILKAFYGRQEKISEIFQKETKVKCFMENRELFIANEISEKNKYFKEDDIFSEVLDIRILLQYFVKNSTLEFCFENLKKIHGLFNPCIEESNHPNLFIKYLYGRKIKYVLLKKNKERCLIGKMNELTAFSLIDLIFRKILN